MNNTEFKEYLISRLEDTQSYFRPVGHDGWFRTRCPLCGDSTDLHKAHFYIKIDVNDNSTIGYNCFKCGKGGLLSEEVLNAFGISDPNTLSTFSTFKKTATKTDMKCVNTEFIFKFKYKIPEIKFSNKTKYIENRLGKKFSKEDFKKMKVITSLFDFLYCNEINRVPFEDYLMNDIDKNYVGFLTEGNSHILFRSINEKSKFNWIKYPINERSNKNKVIYIMKSKIDIFTKDTIEVNLGEGIFDILSACYNLDHNKENTLNIAIGGKGYKSIILYLINLGIVGENVVINIFADNDTTFNKKAKDPTDIEYFKNIFKYTKLLFKEVNVYYNTLSKDIGVRKEQISLKRYKI